MTILAIGDSNSFGFELPDLPQTELIQLNGVEYFDEVQKRFFKMAPSQLSWPAVLGDLRNQPVVNKSLIGGSNDRIFRIAMTESITNKYELIICAWTEIARFDFAYKDQDLPLTVNSTHIHNQMPWLEKFVKYHYYDLQSLERWVINVIALQNHFKTTQQKFLFFNTSCEYWTLFKSNQSLADAFNKHVDKKYFYQPGRSVYHWGLNPMPSISKHLDVTGQRNVALTIHNYLLEIGF
jgi:hypothetical protein